MIDKPREYCGIFGVFDHADAALLSYYGLVFFIIKRGGYTSRLLSAMLKGVQSIIAEQRRIGVIKNAKNTAIIARFINHYLLFVCCDSKIVKVIKMITN